jgi:DNA mismatch repair protein MSH3
LILQRASPRSLVILDELGRGTSTFDGVAIAQSTLQYIVRRIGAACLFVTHYPEISALVADGGLAREGQAINLHMAYLIDTSHSTDCTSATASATASGGCGSDGNTNSGASSTSKGTVLFLYKAVASAAKDSFGINAGRMAGLDERLLAKAEEMSNRMRDGMLGECI